MSIHATHSKTHKAHGREYRLLAFEVSKGCFIGVIDDGVAAIRLRTLNAADGGIRTFSTGEDAINACRETVDSWPGN